MPRCVLDRAPLYYEAVTPLGCTEAGGTDVRRNLRRIAIIWTVAAASSLIGGAAMAAGDGAVAIDVPRLPSGGPSTGGGAGQRLAAAVAQAKEWGDNALGLGGTNPGPIPAPAPGLHPEGYINAAIQVAAQAGGDVGRGLGGVTVGPIPAPAPGIEPDPGGSTSGTVNSTTKTAGKAVEDAALGLGGVTVGPIPAPSPGIKPLPGI